MKGVAFPEGFSELVRASLDGTLRGTLGDSATSALFYHIGAGTQPTDVEEFHVKLPRILGDQATMVVEKMITKDLFSKLGLPSSEDGPFDFLLSLNRAREAFLKEAR